MKIREKKLKTNKPFGLVKLLGQNIMLEPNWNLKQKFKFIN